MKERLEVWGERVGSEPHICCWNGTLQVWGKADGHTLLSVGLLTLSVDLCSRPMATSLSGCVQIEAPRFPGDDLSVTAEHAMT
jgi:hypothetical protein